MSDTYKLVGREPIPVTLREWSDWFERSATERRVAFDDVAEGVTVSTVFLGMDHQYGNGPPLLFETMVFGGPLDGEMGRCSTYDQAEQQHADIVKRATEAQSKGITQ